MILYNYLTAHFRNVNKQFALLRHYMKQEFGIVRMRGNWAILNSLTQPINQWGSKEACLKNPA
jgi:hypothetical protein